MDTKTEIETAAAVPAAMSAALQSRLLAAMQRASDEEHECREMEQLLRRMHPADMPARLVGQLGVQMFVEAGQKTRRVRRRSYLWCGSAAAALLFCAVAGSLLMSGNAVAEDNKQGLASRNVIDARSTGRVIWRQGEAPKRHYEVLYEDSFVLESEEATTVIRVPNKTQVEVEEEYL